MPVDRLGTQPTRPASPADQHAQVQALAFEIATAHMPHLPAAATSRRRVGARCPRRRFRQSSPAAGAPPHGRRFPGRDPATESHSAGTAPAGWPLVASPAPQTRLAGRVPLTPRSANGASRSSTSPLHASSIAPNRPTSCLRVARQREGPEPDRTAASDGRVNAPGALVPFRGPAHRLTCAVSAGSGLLSLPGGAAGVVAPWRAYRSPRAVSRW